MPVSAQGRGRAQGTAAQRIALQAARNLPASTLCCWTCFRPSSLLARGVMFVCTRVYSICVFRRLILRWRGVNVWVHGKSIDA